MLQEKASQKPILYSLLATCYVAYAILPGTQAQSLRISIANLHCSNRSSNTFRYE